MERRRSPGGTLRPASRRASLLLVDGTVVGLGVDEVALVERRRNRDRDERTRARAEVEDVGRRISCATVAAQFAVAAI